MASLRVEPHSALVDEDVAILIDGLQHRDAVTLVAFLRDEKITMVSYAHYVADENGTVDVTKLPSLGGTYEGVEPMGFIWSMVLTQDQPVGVRLMKRDVQQPLKVEVRCYMGHIAVKQLDHTAAKCLCSSLIKRWYMADNVNRVDIREGELVATLFSPKGAGPFPGVLDLFGTVGGLVEYRAALLASRGFVTISLAYFWPGEKIMTELEYFVEALELLWRHPKVLKTGLGIIGVSYGATLGFLLSIVCPKVRAVVSINGPAGVVVVPATYHGETFHPVDLVDMHTTPEGIIAKRRHRPNGYKNVNLIPVERGQADLLLVHGCDDGATPPVAAEEFPRQFADAGRPAACKVLMYEGAGHLIEPPHSPHFRTAFHKVLKNIFIWGGQTKTHAQAQEDSWQQIQNFFRTTLTRLPEQLSSKL